jgi:pimeloyl-ACP methyl ester carboxylesterase
MEVARRDVTVHRGRVSFLESVGDRPLAGADRHVVVLVHGLAGDSATWLPVLEELDRRRHGYRFIAPDLVTPDHSDHSLGGYANGIRDLLARLGHHRATVIGHSLGGGIALQFAYQYSHICARLGLISSGGLGPELHPLLRAATVPGAEWVLPWLAHPRVISVAGKLHSAALRLSFPAARPSLQQSAAAFASLSDAARRRAFVLAARNVIDRSGQRASGLDKLYLLGDIPTLIVWGSLDPLIPVSHGHAAAEVLPGARFELFEGAGHFPHSDQPARFTDLLLDFLDTTEPAESDPETFATRLASGTD